MLPQPRYLLDPFGRSGSTLIRMKIERSGWRALTPAAAGIVVAMSGSTAMAKTFHLTISGDTDARYAGACVVTRASSDERIALEGAVPAERAFVADGLSCGLRAETSRRPGADQRALMPPARDPRSIPVVVFFAVSETMKSGRSLPRIVKGKSSPNRNRTYPAFPIWGGILVTTAIDSGKKFRAIQAEEPASDGGRDG